MMIAVNDDETSGGIARGVKVCTAQATMIVTAPATPAAAVLFYTRVMMTSP
jgi:hypothetical protein